MSFRELHERGCFVIPNPWDVGSAVYLHQLGFKALATTSAGYAYSIGLPDDVRAIPLETMLRHVRDIAQATPLPVNADFQSGFADAPEGVARNVAACAKTGAAGLSIEDNRGDGVLYERSLAIERVKAARQAAPGMVLTARCEAALVGLPDALNIALDRLVAFADAGADCLYAPGIRTHEQIETVVKAAGPLPVNLLMSTASGLTVKDIAALGVRRISVGGTLARVAMNAFIKAATEIVKDGKFDSFAGVMPNAELNKFFSRAAAKKSP